MSSSIAVESGTPARSQMADSATASEHAWKLGPRSSDYPGLRDFLDILGLLIREPSVVGTEDSFFRVIRRELE